VHDVYDSVRGRMRLCGWVCGRAWGHVTFTFESTNTLATGHIPETSEVLKEDRVKIIGF